MLSALWQFITSKPVKEPPRAATPTDALVAALRANNCPLSTDPDTCNIVYVEAAWSQPLEWYHTVGNRWHTIANDNRINDWNDTRLLLKFDRGKPRVIFACEATTETGTYYDREHVIGWGGRGAALIAFGNQRAWQVGIHHPGTAHEALVQTGGDVAVYRDTDRSFRRQGQTYSGAYGINHHSTGRDGYVPDSVGAWSAGCLVARRMESHRTFMSLVKQDYRYQQDHQNVFDVSVIPVDWIKD